MTRVLAGVRWAVRAELRSYGGALRLLGRRFDVPEGSSPVRYVGAVSALLWGFTILSAVELVAVHLIVPWEAVRLPLDVLGIWGVLWCFGFTGCHYAYPHLLDETSFRVRLAARSAIATIPLDAVAAVSTIERSHSGSRGVRIDEETGALVVAVGGRTNLDLRLDAPVEVTVRGRPTMVQEVRIFTDEPRETARELRARAWSGADDTP